MNKPTNLAIGFLAIIFSMFSIYSYKDDIGYMDGPFSFQNLEDAFCHGVSIISIIIICSLVSSTALIFTIKII